MTISVIRRATAEDVVAVKKAAERFCKSYDSRITIAHGYVGIEID